MHGDPFSSILFIAMGAVMIVAPRSVADRGKRAQERWIAERQARGTDLYFEELRSLQTYKPMKRIWAIRLVGALFAALGLSYFYF